MILIIWLIITISIFIKIVILRFYFKKQISKVMRVFDQNRNYSPAPFQINRQNSSMNVRRIAQTPHKYVKKSNNVIINININTNISVRDGKSVCKYQQNVCQVNPKIVEIRQTKPQLKKVVKPVQFFYQNQINPFSQKISEGTTHIQHCVQSATPNVHYSACKNIYSTNYEEFSSYRKMHDNFEVDFVGNKLKRDSDLTETTHNQNLNENEIPKNHNRTQTTQNQQNATINNSENGHKQILNKQLNEHELTFRKLHEGEFTAFQASHEKTPKIINSSIAFQLPQIEVFPQNIRSTPSSHKRNQSDNKGCFSQSQSLIVRLPASNELLAPFSSSNSLKPINFNKQSTEKIQQIKNMNDFENIVNITESHQIFTLNPSITNSKTSLGQMIGKTGQYYVPLIVSEFYNQSQMPSKQRNQLKSGSMIANDQLSQRIDLTTHQTIFLQQKEPRISQIYYQPNPPKYNYDRLIPTSNLAAKHSKIPRFPKNILAALQLNK